MAIRAREEELPMTSRNGTDPDKPVVVEALRKHRVKLGGTYPVPIVDHGEARIRALAQFKTIKGKQ